MTESESIQEASVAVETAAVETAAAAANANADIFPNWRSFKIKNQSSTRSACPHYKGVPPDGAGGSDSDQNMDADAIKYLQGKSVKFIISANANQLSKAQQDALTKAGIGYKWLPVPDFQAPKKADFDACYAAYTAHTSGVHFYCGWGNGRSGTYITGVQISSGLYPNKRPTRADYDNNHVEKQVQRDALDKYWDDWHSKKK
ncbi:hypothetical protein BC835DRAFT_1409872 [Cytidiella melzeri]|nr:hypothetical protein BC835DRAFT_1302584 [Cytidiella melzeri]KAI0705808.1 hypothetical protein BC835DRAFT_1409872 [Cytidiella melzeri]